MYWKAMRIYHRYSVVGLSHLPRNRSALLVGYHGRPIAHDMCMLTTLIYDQFGYMPHGIVHRAALQIPILKNISQGLGFLSEDGEEFRRAVERGEYILLQPGGTREGCRSFRTRYRVDWGLRMGYLKLALRHSLPIVPVVAQGVDDTYIGLNNGYSLGKRLHAPLGLPLWLGLGPLGPWPISPPFPVKITQYIGEAIDLEHKKHIDIGNPNELLTLHTQIVGRVQQMLDRIQKT